jgi:hypothetical protein
VATYGDHRYTRRGSFGLLVRDLVPDDDDADDRLILTAAHLFEGAPKDARVGCAPCGPKPNTADGQPCGVLRRRVPLHHLPLIGVDAAVVKPRPNLDCNNELACGAPIGVRDLWVVEDDRELIPVTKYGAQTHETGGQLRPAAADVFMKDVNARYSMGWWARTVDGNGFADQGDSGAIVVDDSHHVIGMLVGINNPEAGTGFVHGIRQIFSALQIGFYEP